MGHERGSKAEAAEYERPSRVRGETGRASVPPRDQDDAVTSKVVPRERIAREDRVRDEARTSRPEGQERVEREPMARVVDAAAWREERPRLQGERESVPPRSQRGE